jgi:hypothetical protein
MYLRCDIVESIFSRRLHAADPSSVLFGTSHDHLPPYASSLAASLSAWKHRSYLATATHHRGISRCKLGSVVWTASLAYPACRRIPSQDGERRGGCRESGVAEPRTPLPALIQSYPSPAPQVLALDPRLDSSAPDPPLFALPGPIGTRSGGLRAPSVAVTSGP